MSMIKPTSRDLSNKSKATISLVLFVIGISLYLMLSNSTANTEIETVATKTSIESNIITDVTPIKKDHAPEQPIVAKYLYEHLIPEHVGTEDSYDYYPYKFALAEVIDVNHPLYSELYALVINNGKANEGGDLTLVLKNNTPKRIDYMGRLNENHPDYAEIMAENQRQLYLPSNDSKNLDHDFVGNYRNVELVITTHNTLVAYRMGTRTDGPVTSESLKKVFDKHLTTSKGEVENYLASNIQPVLQEGEFNVGEIYCSNTYCIGHYRKANKVRLPSEINYNSGKIRKSILKETVRKYCAECYVKEVCSGESESLDKARQPKMTVDESIAYHQKTPLKSCTIEIIKQ
jgi:hypothetical protein